MSSSPLFPRLADANLALDPNGREFIVDDVRRVVINGCRSVDRVFIDGTEIPFTEFRPMAKQDPGKEVEMVLVEMPLLAIQDVPEAGRCLVRSVLSNDGNWQLGAKVVVIGDWEDGPGEHFVSSHEVLPILADKDATIAALQKENDDLKAQAKAKEAEGKKPETKTDDPAKVEKAALIKRAKDLGINTTAKSSETLAKLIEAKEAEGK